jgi:hypothetical protein
MLRSIKSLEQLRVIAKHHHKIGTTCECLFDDEEWTLRYFIVEAGEGDSANKLLVSPKAVDAIHWSTGKLFTDLTLQQVSDSPAIDIDGCISCKDQMELHNFYGWPPPYWSVGTYFKTTSKASLPLEMDLGLSDAPDLHLKKIVEVEGCHLRAEDGEVGIVDDFYIDDEDWVIRYIMVKAPGLPEGARLLIPPNWATNVRWCDGSLRLDSPAQDILMGPKFNPQEPLTREFEIQLYNYYVMPNYWSAKRPESIEKR